MSQRIILITGANRGLGYALSDALSADGEKVIMVCRDKQKGQAAIEKLQSQGREVVLKVADTSNLDAIDKLSEEIAAEFGHIDVLINNAAINIDRDDTRIENIELELLESTMQTNFTGPLWMCKKFIPLIKKSKEGRIINFSSGLGQLTVPRMGPYPAYSISKTAINALTKILAEEVKDDNILVVSLDPGWVRTDLGGPNAMLSIEEGIETPYWLATEDCKNITTGECYKEKKILGW